MIRVSRSMFSTPKLRQRLLATCRPFYDEAKRMHRNVTARSGHVRNSGLRRANCGLLSNPSLSSRFHAIRGRNLVRIKRLEMSTSSSAHNWPGLGYRQDLTNLIIVPGCQRYCLRSSMSGYVFAYSISLARSVWFGVVTLKMCKSSW